MHETTTKRPGRAGKYIRRALLALAAVILAAVLVLLALFQAELRTLNTIERVDDTDLFTMTYLGDYGLDDFLAQGGTSNDNELLDFLMQKLLKGLPLRFDIPDLGCSTFAAETPEGDAIFGRNFDMYYSPALFVRTAPEDGYRSISMVNLSYIGFWGGQAAHQPAGQPAHPGRPLCPSGRPERERPGGGSAAHRHRAHRPADRQARHHHHHRHPPAAGSGGHRG